MQSTRLIRVVPDLLAFPLFFAANFLANHYRAVTGQAFLPGGAGGYFCIAILSFGIVLPTILIARRVRQAGSRSVFGRRTMVRHGVMTVLALGLGGVMAWFALAPDCRASRA